MNPQAFVAELTKSQQFFERSTDCLEEKDSGFAPQEGLMTVAQHVAHVAHTVDWFIEGAFRPEGFDLDFSKFETTIAKVTSLEASRQALRQSFDAAREAIGSKSMEELATPLPEGPVMGGVPRLAIVGAIVEHTAHHRGALSVYSRLAGHTPAMPYEV